MWKHEGISETRKCWVLPQFLHLFLLSLDSIFGHCLTTLLGKQVYQVTIWTKEDSYIKGAQHLVLVCTHFYIDSMASLCFYVFQNSISPMWIIKSPQKKTSFCFKYINKIYFLLKTLSPKIPFSSWLLTCFTNMKLRYQSFVPFRGWQTELPRNNCFVWYGTALVSSLCRSSSRVQFEHIPLGLNQSTFSCLHTHRAPDSCSDGLTRHQHATSPLLWHDPDESSSSRQYASGPATQEMFARQTAMSHLPGRKIPRT